MEALVMRIIRAAFIKPRVMAGRHKERKWAAIPWLGGTYPETGNHLSLTANSSMRNSPRRKLGREIPAREITVTEWSTMAPFFLAAIIPNGMAMTAAMIREYRDRNTVGCRWLKIMESTVSFPDTLSPKSPWSTLPTQTTYCSKRGRFSPIRSRRAAISASVAISPNMAAAGSPGTS